MRTIIVFWSSFLFAIALFGQDSRVDRHLTQSTLWQMDPRKPKLTSPLSR